MTEAIPVYLLKKRIGCIYSRRNSVCDLLDIPCLSHSRLFYRSLCLSSTSFVPTDISGNSFADRQGSGTLCGSEWAAHASNCSFTSVLSRSLISSRPRPTGTALEQISELGMSTQPKAGSICLNSTLPQQRVFNKVQFCCPRSTC